MHELVIRGGNIVDGTGAPCFVGDVAIDDGVITAVGVIDEPGEREVDATGLAVMPGWVDIHTHYDGQVTWDPRGDTVELARRDHRGDGQLRRRLRARASRRPRLPHRADGERRGHPRDRPARGHGLAVGVVPRVPRCARIDRSGARHRRPGPPRRAARLRDGRTCPRGRHRRGDVRDGAAHAAGVGGRSGRLLHVAHHAAPLQARADPGHQGADRRTHGDRRRRRRCRPRRVPADRRRVTRR